MTENIFYTKLQNRGLVKVSGEEARSFLQGLLSNDINLLDKQPCVYACLLTAQGKFLHDFFITEKEGVIFLECEGGARAEDLTRRLSMYKLRANIKIECEKNIGVYTIFLPLPPLGGGQGGGAAHEETNSESFSSASPPPQPSPQWGEGVWADPRHPALGYHTLQKPKNLEEKPFEAWDRHRILFTVPDGSRDMIVEKSTLLESNIDKLNGISFEKGCYVGQELTARMHYRGLAKKHLYTVKNRPEKTGEEISIDGQLIGEMRSSCGDVGLALLKDEYTGKLKLL